MSYRVIQLNHSDFDGGASRAAYRIHNAVRKNGVNSTLMVNNAKSGDWTVKGPRNNIEKFSALIRPHLGKIISKLQNTKDDGLKSPAIIPSYWHRNLNSSNADLIHLHWVNSEMLSISDIGKIIKPVVWTMHDMWPFCGTEHYSNESRWRFAYNSCSRSEYDTGIDINRLTWIRKWKHWKKPLHIVCPSNWMAECVKQSSLMKNWPVTMIHNAINTEIWKPLDKNMARALLNLPTEVPLLLFGAMGGSKDNRKGFDLLLGALMYLKTKLKHLRLVVFGELEPENPPNFGFPIHYLGHLHDDVSLRVLYSACDLLVIPSRQDNLPNTGVEAMACGTPIVAFKIGGLLDIVDHKITGYMANPFDIEDLANGIEWVLGESNNGNLQKSSRNKALSNFSNEVVGLKYIQVYKNVLHK